MNHNRSRLLMNALEAFPERTPGASDNCTRVPPALQVDAPGASADMDAYFGHGQAYGVQSGGGISGVISAGGAPSEAPYAARLQYGAISEGERTYLVACACVRACACIIDLHRAVALSLRLRALVLHMP